MPYLIAAVALVGVIALLNLLLVMAVIRRLRRHESQSGAMFTPSPAVGTAVPDFEAVTIAGERLSRESILGAESIFAFMATDCSACKPSVPYLIEYIDHHGMLPSQAIVVIGGDLDSSTDLQDLLGTKTAVVVEEPPGQVANAFQVMVTPTFVMIDSGGTVSDSASGSRSLIGG